jgi:hypothetical protein
MDDHLNDSLGAIVSAKESEPLLYAARSEPVDICDSGWQFSADPLGGGEADEAQIWALNEVLEQEPSLRRFIDLPAGTILSRTCFGNEWQKISV